MANEYAGETNISPLLGTIEAAFEIVLLEYVRTKVRHPNRDRERHNSFRERAQWRLAGERWGTLSFAPRVAAPQSRFSRLRSLRFVAPRIGTEYLHSAQRQSCQL